FYMELASSLFFTSSIVARAPEGTGVQRFAHRASLRGGMYFGFGAAAECAPTDRAHGGCFAACRVVLASLYYARIPWATALRAIALRLQAKYMPPLAG
ncbi:hypothetical protein, partial [Mitsuokella jalaludinii]|uniref:hypothetical protein n=1 Tax=Mitsuokella jalaludinii TaxID=187979 RepID=UPI0030781D92